MVNHHEIVTHECDVFPPCALGGVINADNINQLKTQIICGGANNPLADDSFAQMLLDRGVTFVPDFIANAGGVILASMKLNGYDEAIWRERDGRCNHCNHRVNQMLRYAHLSIAVILFIAIKFASPLSPMVASGLALLVVTAWLWLTEALHVTVTALLVPLIASMTGIFTFPQALSNFANPIIFLFLGGFALAAGLHQQGLDRWMANWVMQRANGQLGRAARWLFVLTAFLSMWISNTATAAMMLPLALGLLSNLDYQTNRRTWVYVLLGVAFSANIGGIGTLVGSPPNAIAAAEAGITFVQWLSFGIPLVLILLPLMDITLRKVLKPTLTACVTLELEKVIWSHKHTQMLLVFLITVWLWIFGAPLGKMLGIGSGFDAAVALFALIMLHAMKLATWREIEASADWGVLLLFGGGITLSAALSASGTGHWLASIVSGSFDVMPALVILTIMILFAIALTQVASNTATAALLIPLFIDMVPHINSVVIAVMVAIATSCAFLLPVATPPNAIIFGSGKIAQKDMLKYGGALSLTLFPILIMVSALAIFISV